MKILLCRGKGGLIAKAIQWQTRSPYSHASILDQAGYVYEAAARGVVKVDTKGWTWEDAVKHWGEIEVLDVPVSQGQHADILAFLEAQLGKGYDYTMVLRFITRKQESRASTGKWFCSELVFAAFHHAGLDLLRRTEPWEVSPGLLSRTPLGQELAYQKSTRLDLTAASTVIFSA